MAYMRWSDRSAWYIYGGPDGVVISGGGPHPYDGCNGTIPYDVFEELVAMFWADMTVEERDEAIQRALEKHWTTPAGHRILQPLLSSSRELDA